jgi:hypothetical protein
MVSARNRHLSATKRQRIARGATEGEQAVAIFNIARGAARLLKRRA